MTTPAKRKRAAFLRLPDDEVVGMTVGDFTAVSRYHTNNTKRKFLWICGNGHQRRVTLADVMRRPSCQKCVRRPLIAVTAGMKVGEFTAISLKRPSKFVGDDLWIWECKQGHRRSGTKYGINTCRICNNKKEKRHSCRGVLESEGEKFRVRCSAKTCLWATTLHDTKKLAWEGWETMMTGKQGLGGMLLTMWRDKSEESDKEAEKENDCTEAVI